MLFVFLTLDVLMQKKKKRTGEKRTRPFHPITSTSLEFGAFYSLYNMLLTDDEKFFNYCTTECRQSVLMNNERLHVEYFHEFFNIKNDNVHPSTTEFGNHDS